MGTNMNISKIGLTPQQLDKQNSVLIDSWIDINCARAQEWDNDHDLSIKWMKMAAEAQMLRIDTQGRLWGESGDGKWFPYHFEHGNKLVGYKLSSLAAN
jgi:hypothetical protein